MLACLLRLKCHLRIMIFKEIFQLAEQGNRDALLVRNECIEIWGAAVINFIHAYDPEVVILGGGIMNSHK